LKEKLQKEGISIRGAAREIGVSHTTLLRVLDNQPIDVDTLVKTCDFIGIAPSFVLDTMSSDKHASLEAKMKMIARRYPRVEAVFEEALRRLEAGEVEQQAVDDLVSFAAYRLGIKPE
jgi:lambda repressor-like predicted transcriptional regulator